MRIGILSGRQRSSKSKKPTTQKKEIQTFFSRLANQRVHLFEELRLFSRRPHAAPHAHEVEIRRLPTEPGAAGGGSGGRLGGPNVEGGVEGEAEGDLDHEGAPVRGLLRGEVTALHKTSETKGRTSPSLVVTATAVIEA